MYKRLRDMREDSDLKQREIAAQLGCTQVCYSCYEIGRREIPVEMLIKLAAFYGVSVDYLLGLTDEKKPHKKQNARSPCTEESGADRRIYKHLKELRREERLNQTTVAEFLKCSQVCYSFYEIGRRDVPTDVLVRLAEFYGTSVDYILGLTDERKPYAKGSAAESAGAGDGT